MTIKLSSKRASIDINRLKIVTIGILSILTFFFALPAHASFCRNYHDQLICIISIKRSAKNHWEYRTSLSVDGLVRPIEIYDCQQKIRIQNNKTIIPFQVNDPGKLICSLLNK